LPKAVLHDVINHRIYDLPQRIRLTSNEHIAKRVASNPRTKLSGVLSLALKNHTRCGRFARKRKMVEIEVQGQHNSRFNSNHLPSWNSSPSCGCRR